MVIIIFVKKKTKGPEEIPLRCEAKTFLGQQHTLLQVLPRMLTSAYLSGYHHWIAKRGGTSWHLWALKIGQIFIKP